MSTLDIKTLMRPDAFPHAADDLMMIETHISWVVLAGQFAYKIKKPVRNNFLDYSSLELRRKFCDLELLLNRRFAPELYLEVVALTQDADGIRVQGAGEAVEYAVKMRRFAADALMSQRMATGQVHTEHVRALAQRMAGFHAMAAMAPVESRFGSASVVYQEAMDNCRDIRQSQLAARGGASLLDSLDSIQAWTTSTFEQHRALFELRKAHGHVRECHGDLHLGNIVWWQNEFIPFDGIEFSEEFRWIDTSSDLAFLAMDMMATGHPGPGHSLINAYLEFSADYECVPAIAWYLVFRAMVRAKVAALRASQVAIDSEPHREAIQDFQTHLQLAMKIVQDRHPRPRLWITHGVSGSGKTFGSESLVQQTGAIRIRSDVERKRLPISPAELYTTEVTDRTYERLAELTEQLISCGSSVIVDATFLTKARRDMFRRLAERCQVAFRILSFTADEATLQSRIASRRNQGQDASDADVNVLKHQLETLEPLNEEELNPPSAEGR